MSEVSPPAAAALNAITLAIEAAREAGMQVDAYRVVLVENRLSGRDASAVMWRVGFKLAEAIPAGREGKIGKGGVLEAEVDTEAGIARIL